MLYKIPLVTEGVDSLCSVHSLVSCSAYCFMKFFETFQSFNNTPFFHFLIYTESLKTNAT